MVDLNTINAPAVGGFAVTPSDSTVFNWVALNNRPPRALWVGGAGNVALVMDDGTSITLTSVAAGTRLDVVVQKVLATGTTATAIVALY